MEDRVDAVETDDYEAPWLEEIGDVAELTLGNPVVGVPDGMIGTNPISP